MILAAQKFRSFDAVKIKDDRLEIYRQFVSVEDVLISRQNKRKNNFKWYAKLRPRFDKLFGEGWKDPEKEFWDEFDKKHVE